MRERDQNGQLTNNFTLSFRSTEYRNQSQGGDYERDGLPGADGEIAGAGFAFAQLVSMERYYRELKTSGLLPQNAVLSVTGYSLGGHLATVFTELHSTEIQHTYTFNGAGRGHISGGSSILSETDRIRGMLDLLEAKLLEIDPNWNPFTSGNPENIYTDARYTAALQAVLSQYSTTPSLLPPGEISTEPGFDKVTQLYGHATNNDPEYVANSGVHASGTSIFIEDQPNLDGFGGVFGSSGDFGTTHSIILMVDSLALTELFQTVTPTLDRTVIERLFAASSSQRAIGSIGFAGTAEANSLENALDALRKIFTVGSDDPVTDSNPATGGFGNIENRNQFYDHINQIKSLVASGLFSIDSLVDQSPSAIASLARVNTADGLAYRYALQELIPFAVRGVDYGMLHNQGPVESRPLDLYDAQTGQGTWTTLALSDRAELLAKRMQFNVTDGGTVQTDTHYLDIQTGFEIGNTSSTNEVIFGDDRVGDVLFGHAGDDHLYGRDGADTIEGNEGSDYIEGGLGNDPRLSGGAGNDILLGQQGNDQLYGEADNDRLNGGLGDDRLDGGTGLDTYFYRTGQGQDRIVDADKVGAIVFDNHTLVGGLHRPTDSANTYVSPDGQFTYVKSGTNLVINSALTIENFDFDNGALGIKLADTGELASSELPVQGPVERIWTGTPGWDDLNTYPFTENHVITAGGGNDLLNGAVGDDRLYGEDGADILWGGEGRDLLDGGDGIDRLEGDDVRPATAFQPLFGLPDTDYLDGGTGDDVLIRNRARKFVLTR
jgi:Ca2+-binding RTX toxin-like protein